MNHLRFSKVVRHFNLDNQSQEIILLPEIELGPSLRTLFVAPEFGHQVSSEHTLELSILSSPTHSHLLFSSPQRPSHPQLSLQNTKD
ncbi:hypothetical protein PROFUN_15809 [Planoprotostelium fungivorum]|uniref:Uncharacterized protein n=1 Tax=Planoprotostelium fungivorum TaxID=1890364 RepID=A0A2P6MUI3_9EUKA|nr:hypothetical protein PROFUN_15809 [Planoprotostelium fungivorum]